MLTKATSFSVMSIPLFGMTTAGIFVNKHVSSKQQKVGIVFIFKFDKTNSFGSNIVKPFLIG